MSDVVVQLNFLDVSDKQADILAASLLDALRDIDAGFEVNRVRIRPDTQDFGASLVLVLGTAAAQVIARGISTWIARNSGAQIEIMRDGKPVLVASHLDSADAARIAEAMSSNSTRSK
jgi:hypothetical protein